MHWKGIIQNISSFAWPVWYGNSHRWIGADFMYCLSIYFIYSLFIYVLCKAICCAVCTLSSYSYYRGRLAVLCTYSIYISYAMFIHFFLYYICFFIHLLLAMILSISVSVASVPYFNILICSSLPSILFTFMFTHINPNLKFNVTLSRDWTYVANIDPQRRSQLRHTERQESFKLNSTHLCSSTQVCNSVTGYVV